ncbi:hypothetical protein MMC30_002361 [Trapelia coarctata]|nr:hypothetical protein [Trapelia coarctata]
MDPTHPSRPTKNAPRSAKNHTCYYWANGGCKFTEETCLYAHHETGRTANQPVRLEPGRPAVAGRNMLAVEPQHFNWHRIRQTHPDTMPHDDDMEEGEIPPSEQQQELMTDIQRRSYHGHQAHSSRHSATSYPKPWEAAGHDAITANMIASHATNSSYGNTHMDDGTALEPFAGPSSYAGTHMEDETDTESNVFAGRSSSQDTDIATASPFSRAPTTVSHSRPHHPSTTVANLETQLHALKRAYAAQGHMLEEALSALEIGKDIVAEERTVLFHLERGQEMRSDTRAVRAGPMSRSVKDVMGKLDQLVLEYRGLVGEIRGRLGGLGGLGGEFEEGALGR